MGKIKLSACIRVLVCGLLCLWLVSAEVLAKNVTASMWPVSVARDGFSVEEAATVRQHFAPFKLATAGNQALYTCLLYTSPSPRDATLSRMPSSA